MDWLSTESRGVRTAVRSIDHHSRDHLINGVRYLLRLSEHVEVAAVEPEHRPALFPCPGRRRVTFTQLKEAAWRAGPSRHDGQPFCEEVQPTRSQVSHDAQAKGLVRDLVSQVLLCPLRKWLACLQGSGQIGNGFRDLVKSASARIRRPASTNR